MSIESTVVTSFSRDPAGQRRVRLDPKALALARVAGPHLLAAEKSAEQGYAAGAHFIIAGMQQRREQHLDLTLGLDELALVHEGMGMMLAGRGKFLTAHKAGAGTMLPGMYGPDCPCESYPDDRAPSGMLPPDGPAAAS